jgi:CRISPR-associated exonuclease Cas4
VSTIQADLFTGTQVNYYFICITKLWLFSHRITMEQNSDLVAMGRFVHETSYGREKKDIIIDDRIGIDFIKKGEKITVHEVKKSRKMERSHKYQLYYYLWFLNEVKGIPDVEGVLDYPESRERVALTLDDGIKQEIRTILDEIKTIVAQPLPPEPVKKPICRKCAYFDFCWV